jgi:hypothetical protein
MNNNDNEHILTTLDDNRNIQTSILTNFNGQGQSCANNKEEQIPTSNPNAYGIGQIQTTNSNENGQNEIYSYGNVQTYYNNHAPQFQVGFIDRNTKEANINANILTSSEDVEVMPIFGKPIKNEAKVETLKIDSNCKSIFGKPIKYEAKGDIETYESDSGYEPIFGRRILKQRENEERRKEQSHPIPSRRVKRKFSKSRERSKSGSCRTREDLRKRWNTESRRIKLRRDSSRSRTKVGSDRSRSRTKVRRDRSRSRTKVGRDRSRSILFVQNKSRSRSRRMDSNRDGSSTVKDRTYRHEERSMSRYKNRHKDRPRNKTFREQRRSPSRTTVGYQKTTITTFKQEITTSRSRKSSNRLYFSI